ncbi:MAG: NF038143 family protein [Deltaproteobacteria bacterium]|nr:MAG: NF038143 family protein [Deltaproteobacteria bacterium]
MPRDIDKRYEAVLYHEQSWAKAVSFAAMRPKPLTVWEVLIPIFIIFNHMRLKGAREVFAQNLLFTKKLALDAALAVTKNGQSKAHAMSPVEEKTKALLASVKDDIYSEQIRQKQMQEIHLLIDHYCRLLQAEGEEHATLVAHSYNNLNQYKSFLEELKGAEGEVNRAAVKTLGSQADTETLSRIEAASHHMRLETAQKIFQTSQ